MKSSHNVKKVIEAINKALKTNLSIGAEEALRISRIETGMTPFDLAIGGGIPRQAVTEFYGYQSSGKTYIAQRIIAHAQQQGLLCGYVDAEWSYDPVWAKTIGKGISSRVSVVAYPYISP